jgi:hypothetical protein
MARAYGSSAHLLMKRETIYGQAATGNYIRTQTTDRGGVMVRAAPQGDWPRTLAEFQSEWLGRSLPVGCCPRVGADRSPGGRDHGGGGLRPPLSIASGAWPINVSCFRRY